MVCIGCQGAYGVVCIGCQGINFGNIFSVNFVINNTGTFLFQVFFFVPFWDNGFNKARLERIRKKMDLQIDVKKS